MKKFLTLALALAMVLTFSVSVFAASESVGGENGLATLNQPSDINATVGVTTSTADTVYRVDIEWSQMDFVYNAAYNNNWDPTGLTYKDSQGNTWSHKEATIKITNRSNADVTVSATATKNNDVNVDYTFVGTETLLTRADTQEIMESKIPKSVTYTLTIKDGEIPAQAGVIATIDITLDSN